jgi:hypothetical protein
MMSAEEQRIAVLAAFVENTSVEKMVISTVEVKQKLVAVTYSHLYCLVVLLSSEVGNRGADLITNDVELVVRETVAVDMLDSA